QRRSTREAWTQRRIRHPRWKPTDGPVRKFAINVLSAWEFRPALDTQIQPVQRVERVVNLDDLRTMGIMFWARAGPARRISSPPCAWPRAGRSDALDSQPPPGW